MENLLILSSELQSDSVFTSALNSKTSVLNYSDTTTLSQVIDAVGDTGIKRLVLAYHYSGFNKIPFFSTNVSAAECAEDSTYKYFSNLSLDGRSISYTSKSLLVFK